MPQPPPDPAAIAATAAPASARRTGRAAPFGPVGAQRSPSLVQRALVAAVSALLLLLLWQLPLSHDDQALFRVGGAVLDAGGTLYRDHWDVKQPAIYWLYALGNRWVGKEAALAGTLNGVHILLLFWLGLTAVLLSRLGERIGPAGIGWWLAPLLAVATVVTRATVLNVAQVEMFIALPILATLAIGVAALDDAPRRPSRATAWMGAAGLCVAVVAAFKLILAGIPGLIVCLTLYRLWRLRGMPMVLRGTVAAALGCGLGLVAVALPFLMSDSAELFLWTQFRFPLTAVTSSLPLPPPSQLLTAFLNFAGITAPFALPVLLGLWPSSVARGSSPQPARRAPAGSTPAAQQTRAQPDAAVSLILAACVTWLVAGVVVIAAQRFSWHAYHFNMLLWPVALLGSRGAGLAWRRLRADAVAPVTAPGAVRGHSPLAWTAVALTVFGLGLNAVRMGQPTGYPLAPNVDAIGRRPELARLLNPAQPCRSAIAFGSPALLLAADLTPVIPITGQLTVLLNEVQKASSLQLLQSRRPQFVAIEARHRERLHELWPGIAPWLAGQYRRVGTDSGDTEWFEYAGHRAGPGADCPTVLDAVGNDERARRAARQNLASILGPDH